MHFLKRFVDKMMHRESDPINQARIGMLVYLIFAYILFAAILTVGYIYYDHQLQLIRVVFILFLCSSLLSILYFFNAWKAISHTVLIFMTILGAWSNLLIYENINAATLQYIWLASALAFYMHGARWGWFYAIANVLPVLIDAVLSDNTSLSLSTVAKPIHIFVLTYDFILIIFLHNYFFKSFTNNYVKLTQIKNQLNESNDKLNETVKEIQQLSNARMGFLSTMSHELRTPLNGVIGLTNVLLQQEPRKDQEETLSVLRFSAENLLYLINNILDFNKLDSEKLELEKTPFSLWELVENIHASTKVKAQEKQLDFQLEIDPIFKANVLYGDPMRLTQVLLNLLNNAIKFTEKGEIKLFCKSIDKADNKLKVRFTVKDTGIGIEEDSQQKVFEVFEQASLSTTRRYGGTGLGLPIVKKVLALHNSDIQINSAPENGTELTFDIVFTYKKVAAKQVAKMVNSHTLDKDLSGLNILVVEDNTINVLVVQKMLSRFNIHPHIAENGKEALVKLAENNYDLILMDLYMPEMDGYETTLNIRALPDSKKANIPIIALTATTNDQAIEDAFKVGMNSYLFKPFHPTDLLREITKHVF